MRFFQSGFRLHLRTEKALVKVVNDRMLASDHGQVWSGLMLPSSPIRNIIITRWEHLNGRNYNSGTLIFLWTQRSWSWRCVHFFPDRNHLNTQLVVISTSDPQRENLKAALLDRYRFVDVNDDFSVRTKIRFGVPQNSRPNANITR